MVLVWVLVQSKVIEKLIAGTQAARKHNQLARSCAAKFQGSADHIMENGSERYERFYLLYFVKWVVFGQYWRPEFLIYSVSSTSTELD